MPELTDHDILTTLSADFRNLKDSQDIFHKEMKESINDLKNNYASRLDLVEKEINNSSKVYQAKEVQDKMNELFIKRLTKLENWKIYYLGGTAIVGILVAAAWQLFLAYIGKK
jgi:hypothetical protein